LDATEGIDERSFVTIYPCHILVQTIKFETLGSKNNPARYFMEKQPGSPPLRILHLEDNDNDVFFVRRVLQQESVPCEITAVNNKTAFLEALEQKNFDLILADHALPSFDGRSALNVARQKLPDLPFIFVTGSMDEDLAIDTFKHGATDYVLKSRMNRLIPAIRRALHEAEQRRAFMHATAQWKEMEARFAAFMNNSPTVAFMKDAEGRHLYINKRFEECFRVRNEEFQGKTDFDFLPPSVAEQNRANDLAVLAGGKGVEVSERVPTPDGVTRDWMVFKFPFRDSTGQTFLGGVAIDVTEKKQLEAQFLRAQRMETIGILAGGIAHDLNNVLSPILMVAQLLRMKPLDAEATEWVDMLETSANHGAELVKQVLSFSRGVEGERTELHPSHIVRDVQRIIQETFPRLIEIRSRMSKDLWTIKAVPTHLTQVLMNLCVNARDAMPNGGRLEINVENVTIDETYVRLHPDAAAGRYVLICVADTGVGMPPEVLEKIYDPFFTTKEIGKGTGLGLSTVKGIIKSHAGFIHVYSETGKGTTFKIYLPAASSVSQLEKAESRKAAVPSGSGEVILVVDDEAAVRDLIKSTLEKFGYEVITASDGAEGLAAYVQARDKISVVLTDMMMPHMEGQAMIRALRKISPNAQVIALSGHFDEAKIADLFATGPIKMLEKPFAAEDLLNLVAEHVVRSNG
jgi:two-component system cell cycle sensor histidine kinase/response regulator CckA